MFDWIKDKLIERQARKKGEQVPEDSFLKKHKGPIGAAFLAVWGWASLQGCSPVLEIDILSLIHLSCDSLTKMLGYLGFFLVGAGVVKSDDFYKNKK